MTALIETLALSKTFTLHGRGGLQLPVFSGINLSVLPGECLALTGHSGSGKSSLLRCLYGNYAASSGDVRIRHQGDWVSMSNATPREVFEVRRRTVGYVSQFLRVIPRVSTLDIVADPLRRIGVAADEARARAAQWLQRLNLQEHLWHLPPATFSGGEQQRVALARAFMNRPKILFCDEPTGNLDGDTAAVMVDLIFGLNRERGTTLVLVTHDLELARRCARVIRLKGGAVISDETV